MLASHRPKITDPPAETRRPRDAEARKIRTLDLLADAPDARAEKAQQVRDEIVEGNIRTVTASLGTPEMPLTVWVRTDTATGEIISVAHLDHTGKCPPEQIKEAYAACVRQSIKVSEQRGDPKPKADSPIEVIQAAEAVLGAEPGEPVSGIRARRP